MCMWGEEGREGTEGKRGEIRKQTVRSFVDGKLSHSV